MCLTGTTQLLEPPLLSESVCTYNSVAPGLNLKHNNSAYSIKVVEIVNICGNG